MDGYDQPDTARLGDVAAGDLVLVDESLQMWGVAEQVEPDLLEDGYLSLDYRDLESGEPNTISVPDSETVTVRRPALR